jgi:hypothetical protein
MDSNLVILLPRLRQTVSDIEKYSSLLGEYGDTPELRKRLAQLEGAARGGIQEIEKAILDSKLKVGAAGGSQASQRAMLKVEDAFVVDKKNAQAALERSAARRRAAGSKPRSEGGGGGGGGGSSSSGAGGGSIVIEMKGLTAVDAAIAEVRRASLPAAPALSAGARAHRPCTPPLPPLPRRRRRAKPPRWPSRGTLRK